MAERTKVAIVILGFRIGDEQICPELFGRLETGAAQFWERSADYLLLAGGETGDAPLAESTAMEEYLRALGIPSLFIKKETESRGTLDNAWKVRELVEDESLPIETIWLVTSDYHADRAQIDFQLVFGDSVDVSVGARYDTGRDCEEVENEKLLADVLEFFGDESAHASGPEIEE